MTNTLPKLLNTNDFSPFFRSTVGFDRLMRMVESDFMRNSATSYPPYNIERMDENAYRISMAVAGFAMEDIDITVQDNSLSVQGTKPTTDEEKEKTYLHRGIAARQFEQRFQLADHIEVKEASLENGMLHIDLQREIPEHKKPRKISINYGESLFGKAKKLTKKAA